MTDEIQDRLESGLSSEDFAAIEKFLQNVFWPARIARRGADARLAGHPAGAGPIARSCGDEAVDPALQCHLPDTKVIINEIIGAPSRAAVRAKIIGTHSGEWFGIAPTGRSFTLALHEFHHLENDRLTHTWHLEDWLGWLNQMSARPQQQETIS